MNAVEALDELIDQLDGVEPVAEPETDSEPNAAPAGGDAIDQVLGSTPRRTEVRSLRGDAVVENFRRELADGLIRVDTANRLLRLLSQVVGAVLAGRV